MAAPIPPRPLGPDGCRSFHVGHKLHYIQANLNLREPVTPATLVSIDIDSGLIELLVEGRTREVWTHDPQRVADLIDGHGADVAVGSHSALFVPLGGRLISIASLEHAGPCLPPDTTEGTGGFLARPGAGTTAEEFSKAAKRALLGE